MENGTRISFVGPQKNAFVIFDGVLYACGDNFDGRLGLYEQKVTKFTPVDISCEPITFSCSDSHTLVLAKDGTLWGIGGDKGALGILGTGKQRFPTIILTPVPFISISCGNRFTLGLDSNGNVWVVGCNTWGELGMEGAPDAKTFTRNPHLKEITQICSGSSHSLAIDSQNKVWSFGYGEYGALGTGRTTGHIPELLPSIESATSLAAGEYHSLVLDTYGKVWSFGENEYEQLGRTGSTFSPGKIHLENISHIYAFKFSSFVQDIYGKVWGFGYNGQYQLGNGTNYNTGPLENPLLSNMKLDIKHSSLICTSPGETVYSWAYQLASPSVEFVQHISVPTPLPMCSKVKVKSARK
jgi:alpha-tubulin suppressor-like RCC1 family protein